MKKVLLITILVVILVGAYFFINSSKTENNVLDEAGKVQTITKTNVDNSKIEKELDPEEIVKEADQLDQEEDEVDKMIDELEELKF